jgi:hypothetical protein
MGGTRLEMGRFLSDRQLTAGKEEKQAVRNGTVVLDEAQESPGKHGQHHTKNAPYSARQLQLAF